MRTPRILTALFVLTLVAAASVSAQQGSSGQQTTPAQEPAKDDAPSPVFDMGKIVVVGSIEGRPGVGGAVVTRDQIWNFDRKSLDHAVNMVRGS